MKKQQLIELLRNIASNASEIADTAGNLADELEEQRVTSECREEIESVVDDIDTHMAWDLEILNGLSVEPYEA